MSKKENLEELKLFVSKLMNEEQEQHSKRIQPFIENKMGLIAVEETIKVLTHIYNAKMEMLEKVYKEIQRLQ